MVVSIRLAPILFRLLLVLTVYQRIWPFLLLVALLARSAAGFAFYSCSSFVVSWALDHNVSLD